MELSKALCAALLSAHLGGGSGYTRLLSVVRDLEALGFAERHGRDLLRGYRFQLTPRGRVVAAQLKGGPGW